MTATMKEGLMWKVPFRQVYATGFLAMLRQAVWCHVVIRLFPGAVDLAADALANEYHNRPAAMYEQYRHWLRAP